jgi:hypothetical protein
MDEIFEIFSMDEIYNCVSKYVDIQEDVILHSKYYYEKVKDKIKHDRKIIFIVCLCLSVKYLIDESVYNTLYCKLYKIDIKYFNKIELLILKKLNYKMQIDKKCVDGYFKKCILI